MATAYVVCMFSGDSYLSGVLIMAYSLFRTETKHDVVCMVTPDVSENAKKKMRNMNIIVIDIDYIFINSYLDERPDIKRLRPDIEKYCTKWNCLKLVQYEKVFYLDLDMILQKNIDHVFTLETPSISVIFATLFNEEIVNSIPILRDGKPIPINATVKILNERHGTANGGCVLLKPDMKNYEEFLEYTKQFDPRKFNTIMKDDILALYSFYYSKNITWKFLGIKWVCVRWIYNGLCNHENAYLIHFIGKEKPWKEDISLFPDTRTWYANYDSFIEKYPGVLPEKELKEYKYALKNPEIAKRNELRSIERNKMLLSGYMSIRSKTSKKTKTSKNKTSKKTKTSKTSKKSSKKT